MVSFVKFINRTHWNGRKLGIKEKKSIFIILLQELNIKEAIICTSVIGYLTNYWGSREIRIADEREKNRDHKTASRKCEKS